MEADLQPEYKRRNDMETDFRRNLMKQSMPAGIVNNVQIIKSGFGTQNKEVEVDLQSVKWFLTTFRTNFIAKMTGLAQPNLSFYTKGEREIEAANYKTIVKLTKYSHIAKEGKKKIEWLLSDSGLTLHKISQETGVARDTLYKIKEDFKRISYATFEKLVDYASRIKVDFLDQVFEEEVSKGATTEQIAKVFKDLIRKAIASKEDIQIPLEELDVALHPHTSRSETGMDLWELIRPEIKSVFETEVHVEISDGRMFVTNIFSDIEVTAETGLKARLTQEYRELCAFGE